MFFILSKLLLFLISPAFWIITLLLWSFLSKLPRRRRILRIIAGALFVVFTNPFLLNCFVLQWQAKPVALPPGKSYSAAILLSGITGIDKNGKAFFGSDADRFIQTAKLFHAGAVQHIVVTGGYPSIYKKFETSEAEQLRREFIQQNIPAERIFVETKSRNTYENAVNTRHILDSLKLPPPYILVTSSVHVPRAAAVFEHAGLNVLSYPSAFRQIDYKIGIEDFIPSISTLAGWNPFLKEIVGYTIYRWSGKA
jgi:uncharacterized SAM-binding protein YcdF (DUF218 family)